jgi:L-cysteine S-thiosulfotransferase
VALTAYIAYQSPIESSECAWSRSSPPDAQSSSGQGQRNLACAQCHDDYWGQKLGGITVTQGHPTGYPLYRLEWRTLGSLQRRLRNCMIGMGV